MTKGYKTDKSFSFEALTDEEIVEVEGGSLLLGFGAGFALSFIVTSCSAS